jgi:hypothetical protein
MRFFFVFCLLICSLSAEKKVLFITVPKSGTHLLKKAAEQLCGGRVAWIGARQFSQPNLSQLLSRRRDKYFISHLFSDSEAILELDPEQFTKVLLIRDPRDVILSFRNHLAHDKRWPFSKQQDIPHYKALPLDNQMAEAMQYPPFSPAQALPIAAKWASDPQFVVIRFEDLIGEKGGGSEAAQGETLRLIAGCMDLNLTDEKIAQVQNNLFGGTWTFHKGQIGGWHMAFSLENLTLFHTLFGSIVQDLGYAD